MIIPLELQLPTTSSSLPAASLADKSVSIAAYLALLQLGFAVPSPLPENAVSSYLAVAPLPALVELAVWFLWHFPSRQ